MNGHSRRAIIARSQYYGYFSPPKFRRSNLASTEAGPFIGRPGTCTVIEPTERQWQEFSLLARYNPLRRRFNPRRRTLNPPTVSLSLSLSSFESLNGITSLWVRMHRVTDSTRKRLPKGAPQWTQFQAFPTSRLVHIRRYFRVNGSCRRARCRFPLTFSGRGCRACVRKICLAERSLCRTGSISKRCERRRGREQTRPTIKCTHTTAGARKPRNPCRQRIAGQSIDKLRAE